MGSSSPDRYTIEGELNRQHQFNLELARKEEAARREREAIARRAEIDRAEQRAEHAAVARRAEIDRAERLWRERDAAIAHRRQDDTWRTLQKLSRLLNTPNNDQNPEVNEDNGLLTKATNMADVKGKEEEGKQGGGSTGGEGFQDSALGSSTLGGDSNLGGHGKLSPKSGTKASGDGSKDNLGQDSSMLGESALGSTGLGDDLNLYNSDNPGESESKKSKSLFVSPLPSLYGDNSNTGHRNKPNQTADGESESKKSKPLFVSPLPSLYGDNSNTGHRNKPNQTADGESEEDAGLVKTKGLNKDAVVTHWRQKGDKTHIMIRYGPPGACEYLHTTKPLKKFDKDHTPPFGPYFRSGDEKDDDGNYVRTFDELEGIIAEAYKGSVEDLKPKKKWKDKNGIWRTEDRRLPITELFVKWRIGGKVYREWETRSSIKHLWRTPEECDKDIYDIAKKHAKSHRQWLETQSQSGDNDSSDDSSDEDNEDNEEDDEDDEDDDEDDSEDDTRRKHGKGIKRGRAKESKKGQKKDNKKGKGKHTEEEEDEEEENEEEEKDEFFSFSEDSGAENVISPPSRKNGKAKKKGGASQKGKGKENKKGRSKNAKEEDDDIEKMLRYRKRWCALEGIKNPGAMTKEQKRRFLDIWEEKN